MDDSQLLSAIRDEVSWATSTSSDRQDNWEKAADYFYGRLPAPPADDEAAQGMSSVVSTDVQDAVFAVCAEMLPGFTGTAPVEFVPLNDEDATQADLETRAVNHVAQNSGFYLAVSAAIQDAMLRRAGIIKTYWEEKTTVEYERLQGIPIQMLPEVVRDGEITEQDFDERQGVFRTLTVRRYTPQQKPRIDPVPLDEFLISANVSTPNVEEARFKAHQRPVTRSELIELGIDRGIVDGLNKTTQANKASTYSRARDSQDLELRAGHTSTDYVMVCESYYNIDFDGDGIAELRRVVTAGGAEGVEELLLNAPWDCQPFCLGIGYLGIYSWDGVSLFDRLRMIQDVKTQIVRSMSDASLRNLRQRIGAVEGDATVDDIATSYMGGIIRMKTPNGLVPIPDVEIPQQLFATLGYLDEMRKDKGGGAIDATQSAQAVGQGGDWSLERIQSAIEQLNAMVAKNLCETMVKPLFRKLHMLLRRYYKETIMVPGKSGLEQATPSQWNPREDPVIAMGMSTGERTQRVHALVAVLQAQEKDFQAGLTGVLSDLNGAYQARIDAARLAGLPNPEQYFLDPKGQQSMQVQQQNAQQAQMQQQQQMQMQQQQTQQQMQFQYKLMTDLEKVKNDGKIQVQNMQNATKDIELAIKAFAERVNLVKVEAEIDPADAEKEIDTMQAQDAAQRARNTR